MKKTISLDFTMDWPEAFWMLCDVLDINKLVGSEEDLCIHGGKVCRKDKETGEYITVDDRADLFCALRNVLNALAPNLHFRSDHYITNWGDEYPTNGDMIRRMSDRELADFLGKFEDCRDDIFEWLQAEADTGEEVNVENAVLGCFSEFDLEFRSRLEGRKRRSLKEEDIHEL